MFFVGTVISDTDRNLAGLLLSWYEVTLPAEASWQRHCCKTVSDGWIAVSMWMICRRPPALRPMRFHRRLMKKSHCKVDWSRRDRAIKIEVVGPACVVTEPWLRLEPASSSGFRALLNPANSALVGTSRAYFPRGGPVPPPPPQGLRASSAGWGGLDAGENMLYPSQSVDGVTHMHAGTGLRQALGALPARGGERCAVGAAVLTEPFRLAERFDVIAHTPTPFWPSERGCEDLAQWRRQLRSCYIESIRSIGVDARSRGADWTLVATPLLGAGAAGAPVESAAEVALESLASLHKGIDDDSNGALGGHGPWLPPRGITVRIIVDGRRAYNAVTRALRAESLRV